MNNWKRTGMKHIIVSGMLTVIAFGFAGAARANDTSVAFIKVTGINPDNRTLSKTDELSTVFSGESLRLLMEVLPPEHTMGAAGPENSKHSRSLMIVSRNYAINIYCNDFPADTGESAVPNCGVLVGQKNNDAGDIYPWEPAAKMQISTIIDTKFVEQKSGPMSIKFYGQDAAKFASILPPGGLKISGGVNGKGNGLTLDFTCGTGKMGSMTKPGTICAIEHY